MDGRTGRNPLYRRPRPRKDPDGRPQSSRPTREWLLLGIALVAVGAVVLRSGSSPATASPGPPSSPAGRPKRLGKLLLGPEQIACYACFTWASLILLSRYREVRRQRGAFHLDLLPMEEGARILPEDARPYVRKVDAVAGKWGP